MKIGKTLCQIFGLDPFGEGATLEENIHHSRRLSWVQIDVLLLADWHLILPDPDTEPWQWKWRSPSNRHYPNTTQAYNALRRQKR